VNSGFAHFFLLGKVKRKIHLNKKIESILIILGVLCVNLQFREFEVLMDPEQKSKKNESVMIKPLEVGFGNTLGNVLRRVLISSMPGVAAVAFKIDGVNNPFMSIPGSSTDTIELANNLRSLKIAMDKREEVITFKAKKEGEYFFSDLQLPEGINLVNPEDKFITLTGEREVEVKFIIRKGRGAIEASEHQDIPEEYVPIDGYFSPIEKVGYQVKPILEEEEVTHEMLTLNVETDGTITAEESVKIAAKVLEEHFGKFADMKVEKTELEIFEEQEKLRESIDNTTIEELELSVRSTNALRGAGIRNVGELRKLTETELMDIKNMGKKSIGEVLTVLERLDVQLGDY